jgi:hypothetical protein
MFEGLSFAACYFAPTLIAWYRRRDGHPTVGSLGQIFFFNLIAGFTIIGWFLALANAFNRNPVAAIAPRLADFLVRYGRTGAPPPPPKAAAPAGSASSMSCGQCGGSGAITCPACGGRGSGEAHPPGGTGAAQNCPTCKGSGRIQCMACGGSGRLTTRS